MLAIKGIKVSLVIRKIKEEQSRRGGDEAGRRKCNKVNIVYITN